MKNLRIGFCVSALILFALPVSPNASPQSYDGTHAKYMQVLDLVFPTEWCHTYFAGSQVILRFLPSFFKESQIVFCTLPDGKTFLVRSTLAVSDTMVWRPVIEESMGHHKPRAAPAIAARFHPVHQVCDADPAVIADWFKRLRSMSFDVPNGGGNDGESHEITLGSGMSMIHASVWGEDDALSVWAHAVDQAVRKMSCQDTQYSGPRGPLIFQLEKDSSR